MKWSSIDCGQNVEILTLHAELLVQDHVHELLVGLDLSERDRDDVPLGVLRNGLDQRRLASAWRPVQQQPQLVLDLKCLLHHYFHRLLHFAYHSLQIYSNDLNIKFSMHEINFKRKLVYTPTVPHL